jgi:hypothetical protein
MKPGIDELLKALSNPNKPSNNTSGKLENNKNTWTRIGDRDKFSELGLEESELALFLAEWIEENPYNNI